MTDRPKHVSLCAVDGDVICYRAAFATQGKMPFEAQDVVDQLMGYIISETVHFTTDDCFKVFLTGKGNHRYNIAVTAEYKGNRKDKPKPDNLQPARDYLVENYNTVITSGCEADDMIAMATVGHPPEETVIVSTDKDMKTVPCWMFNFVKGTYEFSSPWESLVFFYTQILTGDDADNIKGLMGIGPKKAAKILEGATTELELYERCVKAYEGNTARVLENGRLLHLQRFKGELWCPPV